MKFLPILLLTLVTYQSIGQKQLEVGLKTGQVLYPESIVYKTPLLARPYLLINGEDKIEKELIAYYQAADGFYRFADMGRGLMINRNTRIKRVADGAIEVYEYQYTTSHMSGGAGQYGAPMMQTTTVTEYYQLDPFGNYNFIDEQLLRELVQDDPISAKQLRKRQNDRLLKAGFYGVGGLVALIGTAQYLSEESAKMDTHESVNVPPALFVGGAIMLIPTLINMASKESRSIPVMIRDYNARKKYGS